MVTRLGDTRAVRDWLGRKFEAVRGHAIDRQFVVSVHGKLSLHRAPRPVPRPDAGSLSVLKDRGENPTGRSQISSILKGNSASIARKSGGIWIVQADLQPIRFKTDRLLGFKSPPSKGSNVAEYALGHSPAEQQRLQRQAALLRNITQTIWRRAGLEPGIRVLDVGCGVGDTSFLAADMVGADGMVVGQDRSAEALATARQRAQELGLELHFEVPILCKLIPLAFFSILLSVYSSMRSRSNATQQDTMLLVDPDRNSLACSLRTSLHRAQILSPGQAAYATRLAKQRSQGSK